MKYYTLKHGSVAQIISRSNRPLLKTRRVWYLTCDRVSRVCWLLSLGTALHFWSVKSCQWWCPAPVSGNPGSRHAPPAAPWWTYLRPSECCWRAVRRRPILRHTPITLGHDLRLEPHDLGLPTLTQSSSPEMSSSSFQVMRVPFSLFFCSVDWRPMVILPARFAPFTMVLEIVLSKPTTMTNWFLVLSFKMVLHGDTYETYQVLNPHSRL